MLNARRLIIQIRQQNGWTQAELATAVGVAENTVWKWEAGVQLPIKNRHFERLLELGGKEVWFEDK